MARTVEEVREAASIVDVVSQYIELKRSSNSQYQACCPFHDDKNPSLSVSEDKGLYLCFSCGAKGDVFTFVQEIEGIGFMDSVEKVAEVAGIEVDFGEQGNRNNSR